MKIENIEICTASRRSVDNAMAGGARRVELCRNLELGGLTPDMEEVEYCVAQGLLTRVLIRPRGGDFVYSDEEYRTILRDIARCKSLGAQAVVVGFLHKDGTIDEERTRECVRLAAPMEVTFHRAFDESAEQGLEKLVGCGCHKLLTSGQKPTAWEGRDTIRRLVAESAGRISVIAASGIDSRNAAETALYTGAEEIHGSCKRMSPQGMETHADEVAAMIARLCNEK